MPPSSDVVVPMSMVIGAVPTKPPEEVVSEVEGLAMPSDVGGS